MAKSLKARPTEYKGVVYRSKSEALFARWIELQHDISGFVYEPDFALDEWKPDFLYWSIKKPTGYGAIKLFGISYDKIQSVNWSLPRLSLVYIEYKPAMPTKTYLKRWAKICNYFIEEVAGNSNFFPDDFRFEMHIGGFYGPAIKIYAEAGDYCEDDEEWLSVECRDLCLETRFDLEHSNG